PGPIRPEERMIAEERETLEAKVLADDWPRVALSNHLASIIDTIRRAIGASGECTETDHSRTLGEAESPNCVALTSTALSRDLTALIDCPANAPVASKSSDVAHSR